MPAKKQQFRLFPCALSIGAVTGLRINIELEAGEDAETASPGWAGLGLRARISKRKPQKSRVPLPCHFSLRQVISTLTGISFFTGNVKRDGASILKSDKVVGMVPEIRISFPWVVCWNGTCL